VEILRKPNILFLFSDQHNARCLSGAGHPDVKTPNLDRLAREGIRFDNAYSNNPICTPSRISFLSGLYPSTHGYYGLYGPQPSAPMTNMFQCFREQGYRTGALGKLHTPRYWIENQCQFVYDEFIEYPKYLEGAGLYDLNDNRAFTGNRDGQSSMIPLEHSCEMALAKQTIRFMRNQGEPKDRGDVDAPWFAWVSFSRPHQPYTPSEPFASMYPPESLTLPPVSETEKNEVKEKRSKTSRHTLNQTVSAYLGLVSQVDHAIGEILKELEQRGELENTIIIYTSDHGDYAGEHGLYEKKGGISYRAITGIPMIFRLPKFPRAGEVSKAIVEAVDVFPTLCELAGIEIPNSVQGIDFTTILKGSVKKIRGSALTENAYRKALATKSWRYIANLHEEQQDELYCLDDDPWELQNRIQDPACADIARKMLRVLFHRTVQARKPITTINGGWHEHDFDCDGRIDLHRSGDMNAYW
jgi:arylsulfatase